jgi:hypothetical protein
LIEHASELPKESGGAAADEGTLAHEVCEAMLLDLPLPYGTNPEMKMHADGYMKYVSENLKDSYKVEAVAPLWYAPGDNGHVDCYGELGGHYHVIDYKYGRGITVSAEKNKQLAIYARSIIESKVKPKDRKAIKSVSLHIYQPRSKKEPGEGAASKWTCTWDQLDLLTTREVEIPASLIQKKIAGEDVAHLLHFVPSDKACRFCPAAKAGICTARAEWLLSGNPVTKQMLEGYAPTYKDTDSMSKDMLATLFGQASKVISYFEDLKKTVLAKAISGEKFPGLKLVEGNGSRSWVDDKQAALYLADKGLDTTDISPAAAEEALSGTADVTLEALIVRKPGAPMLAPLSSKRKDWVDPAAHLQDETYGGVL